MADIPITNFNFSFHIQHKGYPTLHKHTETYEFIFILQGKILHKINNRKETLKANDLYFISPQDSHSLHKLTSDAIYVSLTITKEHMDVLLDWISPVLKKDLNKHGFKCEITSEHAMEILQITNRILISKAVEYYKLLHVLTEKLLQEVILAQANEDMKDNYHPAVAKFISLVETNENLTLPLERIVWMTGYSYTHLNKLFIHDTGVSLGKYFSQKKINHAIIMIKCTDENLNAISEKLGFSTYSHFSLFFKKNTGLSPLQYRVRAKEEPSVWTENQ